MHMDGDNRLVLSAASLASQNRMTVQHCWVDGKVKVIPAWKNYPDKLGQIPQASSGHHGSAHPEATTTAAAGANNNNKIAAHDHADGADASTVSIEMDPDALQERTLSGRVRAARCSLGTLERTACVGI